jgi:hypothetical protein
MAKKKRGFSPFFNAVKLLQDNHGILHGIQ